MALDLSALHDSRIAPGTKGVPPTAYGLRVGDIGSQGWNVLDGDLPMPVALLKSNALAGNIAKMQAYLDRSGLRIAPHGKTTMCPDLFDRQLEAGAWGITVATAAQAQLAHSVGVRRILIANEVVGPCELAGLAALGDVELYLLVDSIAGVDRVQDAFSGTARSAKVLIEIGMVGGRGGCRTRDDVLTIARHIAMMSDVELAGVEAYEGLVVTPDADSDAHLVTAYLDMVADCFTALQHEALLAEGRAILTAGGSAYFDLVARSFVAQGAEHILPVLRSGCYITHDHGFYARLLQSLAARAAVGQAPSLQPALEVWATVLSRPEPDRAILSAGKRDLSFDIDLPVPRAHFRVGAMTAPASVDDWAIFQVSDQHAYMRVDPADDVQVGDLICLGISHPCTTFDKWSLLLEVDDDYRVVAGLKTCF